MQETENNLLVNLFQALPDFKGKRRLSRIFLRRFIQQSKDIIISGKAGINYKVPNFSETVGFEILINGMYEKDSYRFIIGKLPPGGLFFDIGANIGAVTIPVCKHRKDIRAVCIEASPRVYDYLAYNTTLNNLDNCILINKAVGEKDGESVSFFSPDDQYGKGSLTAVFTSQSEQVKTVTLDRLAADYPGGVDLIKIDVEGHEYHAFKGGTQLLKREDAPDIFFEFVAWAENLAADVKAGDAQQLLVSYGYQLFRYHADGKLSATPVLTSGDAMLFATKNPNRIE